MQIFSMRFVLLVLIQISILYFTESKLRHCADFDKFINDVKVYPYQKHLEQIFDAFDENDVQQMDKLLKLFENIDAANLDEINPFGDKNDPIKYVPDRIKAEGYPAEVHEVVTDDGYILELHRIPHGKKLTQTNLTRPAVLLMHPFLESSNCWVALGPKHSLAYLLADAGYDVWMGNNRGTEVSRRHVRLNPSGRNQKDYWSFSLHELGIYDLPTFIDHILSTTNLKKLNYIGHSQGGTSFFIMMSERPEYYSKIIDAHLMAPAASFHANNTAIWNSLTHYYKLIKKILSIAKIYKITTNNKLGVTIADIACNKVTNSTPIACKIVLSIIGSNQINCTTLKSILVATPAGASVRQGLHYMQMARSGGFNQFDYDNKRINREKYGRDTPPPYNLTKATTPIHLYYSKDDRLVAAENIIDLQKQIQNLKSSYLVPINDFAHVDFIYSRYLRKVINDKLIKNIDKINDS